MSSLFNRVSSTPSAINTSAANTFSAGSGAATGGLGGTAPKPLFGQSTSQPPASAGLFGQSTAAAPSGGLFGASATTSAPSGGGLFGATNTANTATTSAPAAGGLFGASTTAAASSGGGLFGANPITTSAPAAGGMFGAASTAQPAAGGGLFGAGAGVPTLNSQPAASGGMFGNSSTTGGGMFGGQQQQQQQRPTPTLFGQSAQPTAQPTLGGGGFFSSSAAQPQQNTFGQSQQQHGFGQSQQPQMQAQAVEMNFSNMRGTTRYEELHADVRNLLDYLDDYVHKAIGISQELSARSVGHKETMESVDGDVEHVSRKLGYTTTFLNNDGHSIGQLHNASAQLINTAALSTRTIDILRLPISQRSHYLSSHHTSNPEYSLIPYFEEKTGELEGKTQNFLMAVDEVEKTLEAVERDVGQVNVSAESKVKEIVKAERVVFSGMLAVASKVATVNEDLKSVTR
ncbi:hypothetical protein ABW20_dc0105692 [Dactylellina cionopaga]|nr:hypothetical protein ABW20_dc0105692 [Dactylellina cionopaga]